MDFPEQDPLTPESDRKHSPVPGSVIVPRPVSKRPVSLGKRMTSRTTDLLAIAIVLIGSLALGRQVLEWWRAEPPAVLDGGPLSHLETEWGADGKPVSVEIADSPIRLIRQTIRRGGAPAALEIIQETCQNAILNASPPQQPPNEHETALLNSVSELRPVTEQPGIWKIYRLDGGLVTLVGVRDFPPRHRKNLGTDELPTPRVVCWGLAFPDVSPNGWTAYTFIQTDRGSSKSRSPVSAEPPSSSLLNVRDIPLPSGCRRTLLLEESVQNRMLGFQGPVQPAEWKNHFSEFMASRGWKPVENWRADAGLKVWSARFIPTLPPANSGSQIWIQFHIDSSGQGSGLIHDLPQTAENPKP